MTDIGESILWLLYGCILVSILYMLGMTVLRIIEVITWLKNKRKAIK